MSSKEQQKDFIVLGVTGEPSAGKDTFAKYIEEKRGFVHISSGDYLRVQAEKHGYSLDRPGVTAFVTEMREKVGFQYPIDEIIGSITGNTVVSGFRNMAESNVLKVKFGKNYILVGVTATPEIRYERMKKRGRIGDNLTFAQFHEQDLKDRNNSIGTHVVDQVVQQADFRIDNSGSEKDFENKIDEWFENVFGK